MSSTTIYPQGTAEITIPATESIAVYTRSHVIVSLLNVVHHISLCSVRQVLLVASQTVFGAYASGATIVVEAGAAAVEYAVGVDPVTDAVLINRVQGTPGVLNATGALTAAMMLSGIVTSTTAAAVAGTVPTGTVLDSAGAFAIGDSFDWSVIATGANAFTVTAADGHTLVGTAAVATVTSGRFRTRKTAANTFVTYRLA